MSRTKRTERSNVISLSTIGSFIGYVSVWFAEAATLILKNRSILKIKLSDLKDLYNSAQDLIKPAERGDNACKRSPIPLTTNDKPEILNICSALEMLYEATKGNISYYPLPPALSLEFAEYTRTLMPRPQNSLLKRKVMGISSELLALAIIGADITNTYRIENEHGYVLVNVYNPEIVNMNKLNSMARLAVRRVIDGDGSTLALYMGVSAAVALNVSKYLNEIQGHATYSSTRITITKGRKNSMLKAFEVLDLTSLAQTIWSLGIASALYTLITSYPRESFIKKDRRYRVLKSFIESLSRAVMVYHNLDNLEELYKILRAITSEHLDKSLAGCLGEKWSEVRDSLLSLRV